MTKTNWVAVSVACVLAGLLTGGCASKKNADEKVPLDTGVTDLGPPRSAPTSAVPPDPSYVSMPASASQPKFVPVDLPPAAMPAAAPVVPSYASTSAEPPMMISAAPAAPAPSTLPPAPPAVTRTPAQANAQTPALVPPPTGGGSRQYTVQKGDTLFSIAKIHYGNGNRWQHIAAMNPGLTPATLKAGTTIAVP